MKHALANLQSLLVPDESIEAYAAQRRIFALLHRRAMVCATSGRLIGISRGFFGGFNPDTVRWQDIKEVRIRVGMIGTDLTITALATPDLAIAGQTRILSFQGLWKKEAQAIYRICQAQEQAWREKRRIRELEELRAKSGGIQLGTGGGNGLPLSLSPDSPAARLAQAKEMFEQKLITDSEYESLKARIVGSF
jgi:hypothetical protein